MKHLYGKPAWVKFLESITAALVALITVCALLAMILGTVDAMEKGRCGLVKPKTRLKAIVTKTAPYKFGCFLGEKPEG